MRFKINYKKIIAGLLATSMMLSNVNMQVFAEENQSDQPAITSESVVSENETELSGTNQEVAQQGESLEKNDEDKSLNNDESGQSQNEGSLQNNEPVGNESQQGESSVNEDNVDDVKSETETENNESLGENSQPQLEGDTQESSSEAQEAQNSEAEVQGENSEKLTEETESKIEGENKSADENQAQESENSEEENQNEQAPLENSKNSEESQEGDNNAAITEQTETNESESEEKRKSENSDEQPAENEEEKQEEDKKEEEEKDENPLVPLEIYHSEIKGYTYAYPLMADATVVTNFKDKDELHPYGHDGVDLAAAEGTPVIAAEKGVVVTSYVWQNGEGPDDNAGNYVAILHPDGNVTRYMHLSQINVTAGQEVARGQQIGLVGSTGRSTGPHLHFEVLLMGERYADGLYFIDESYAPENTAEGLEFAAYVEMVAPGAQIDWLTRTISFDLTTEAVSRYLEDNATRLFSANSRSDVRGGGMKLMSMGKAMSGLTPYSARFKSDVTRVIFDTANWDTMTKPKVIELKDGNDNVVYEGVGICVEPNRPTPPNDYKSDSVYDIKAPLNDGEKLMFKVLYYGYNGYPGVTNYAAEMLKASKYAPGVDNCWSATTYNNPLHGYTMPDTIGLDKYELFSIAITHMAASRSFLYSISGEIENYTSSTMWSWYELDGPSSGEYYAYQATLDYIDLVKTLPDPDWNRGIIHFAVTMSNSYQTYVFPEWVEPNGTLKLTKTSANTDMTNGNSCYSLEGAEYKVYKEQNVNSEVVGTLTTNANGVSNEITLPAGTYYIKESKAPKGYKLDSEFHQVTVEAGQQNTVQLTDKPLDDPASIVINKTGTSTLITESSAVFKVEFFGNDNWSGTPLRTWYYKSINGIARLGTESYIDSNYSNSDRYIANGAPTFPVGTIKVTEQKAPTGYAASNAVMYGKVSMNSTGTEAEFHWQSSSDPAVVSYQPDGSANFLNKPIIGALAVQKNIESIPTDVHYQGDASVAGIKFAVVYTGEKNNISIGSSTYDKGDIVYILTTSVTGYATTGQVIPYGNYKIYELRSDSTFAVGDAYDASSAKAGTSQYANAGGIIWKNQSQDASVTTNGETKTYTFDNAVALGELKIVKKDAESNAAHGDANLEGIRFALVNRSAQAVYVDGQKIDKGAVAFIMETAVTTNGTFEASTGRRIPYGTYQVYELRSDATLAVGDSYDNAGAKKGESVYANEYGYFFEENNAEVKIDANEKKVDVEFVDYIVKGGVKFAKFDAETGLNTAQADATLEGAEITIYNNSDNAVMVDDGTGTGTLKSVPVGEKVMTLTTDENGECTTAANALPYGTYYAVETKPSNGYLLNEGWRVDFRIRENEVIINTASADFYDDGADNGKSVYFEYEVGGVNRTADDGRLYEEIKRNDLEFDKLNINGMFKPNIPFAIDRIEWENGKWVIKESHIIVSDEYGHVDTRASERSRTEGANRMDQFVNKGVFSPDSELDSYAGVWFGNAEEATNDRGALPYGTYRIREISCADNQLHHEDLLVSEPIIVHDDVIMNGRIATSDPVEKLEQNNRVFKYHALIDLEVELTSTMKDDESNTHVSAAKTGVSLTDVINYTHLKETSKYRMEVALYVVTYMDDGSISVNPAAIATESQEFTPVHTATAPQTMVNTASGSLSFTFNVDLSNYEGKMIASTARLYEIMDDSEGEYEVLIHTHNLDYLDREQEIAVPTMSTLAIDAATGDNVGAKAPNKETEGKQSIIETVSLKNLAPQEQYMLEAKLVDRVTGEVIDTKTKVFTSNRSEDNDLTVHYVNMEGDYKVTLPAFEVDSSEFTERTLVVYETLYRYDINHDGTGALSDPVLVHESAIGRLEHTEEGYEPFDYHKDNSIEANKYSSLIDEAESIHYVSVATQAHDGATGDHVGSASVQATIVDKVSMKNLIPGKEYTLKGTLVYKEAFTDAQGVEHAAGESIGATAELTFTAEEANETREMTFSFDASALEGKTVVVFEDLYHNNALIAWHADLNDEDQSIHYPKVATTAKDGNTDDKVGAAIENGIIVDTVSAEGLIVGEVFKVSGILMDKATGEPVLVNGQPVRAESEPFTAAADKQEIEVRFTFNATGMAGIATVVFEKLYHQVEDSEDFVEVAKHEDINDEGQEVDFPEVKTTAYDKETGDKSGVVAEETTIVDVVKFKKLVIDKEYTVRGVLMNQMTGEPLLDKDGNEVTAEKTFLAQAADGQIELQFKFDSSLLEGETVVVFESLYHKDILVGTHADLEDEDQFVYYPRIKTFASDASIIADGETDYNGETGTHTGVVKGKAYVRDIVKYENLLPETEYTIQGMLVDKNTGYAIIAQDTALVRTLSIKAADGVEVKLLDMDGNEMPYHGGSGFHFFEDIPFGSYKLHLNDEVLDVEYAIEGAQCGESELLLDISAGAVSHSTGRPIEAYVTFTTPAAEEGKNVVSGEETLTYVINSLQVEGKTIVVFEDLYHNDVLIDSHADLEDADQTVRFPSMRTTAYDKATETKLVSRGETVEIVDKVAYTNLDTTKEYEVRGKLMNRETGEALLDKDGNEIVAAKTFTPDEESGEVEVTFTLDTTNLEGVSIVVFEVLYEEGIIVNRHESLEDADQTVYVPGISTTATDKATGTHAGVVSEEAVVVDEVKYKGLVPGLEYSVDGILMNQETGEALLDKDGNEIHGILVMNGEDVEGNKFTADKANGSVYLEFRFDSSLLAGETVVVFEDVYYNDIHVASHHDIEDEGQTVRYPKIGTSARDGQTELSQGAALGEKITIIDTVKYENLVSGSYIIKGILMDKATGKAAVDMFGDTITSTAVLVVPEGAEMSGTVDVTFTMAREDAEGKTFVVFEYLTMNDITVTEHTDIEDKGQTVDYPKIRTMAVDGITKDEDHIGAVDEKNTIIDKVHVSNLRIGKIYTITGILMDKETNKPILDKDGKQITASVVFKADQKEGTVKLVYNVDSTLLAGKTVVVFEDLYVNRRHIASHADINDEEQSVYYPSVGTTATVNGSHKVTVSATTKLTDVVAYTNLVVGKEYTAKATLMSKETGKALLFNGKPMTVETKFTAETKDGEIAMTFIFDSTKLGGKTVVVFEELYEDDGILIAKHADINDEGQSVKFEIKPVTGDDNLIYFAGLATLALAGAMVAVIIKKRKENAEETAE